MTTPLPPLFAAHCSLPYIPKINFDFVPDCHVTPAGLPTFDCPDIEIPFDTPPPPSACPIVRVETTVEVETSGTDPTAAVVVTRDSATSDSACRYLFDFDFKLPKPIPGPCPDLRGSAAVDLTYGRPKADVIVTRIHPGNDILGSSEQCAYLYDFEFKFPPVICASLTASVHTNITPGRPSVHLLLTQDHRPSICQYAFDFEFKLPPAICPAIKGKAETTITTGKPSVHLLITHEGVDGVSSSSDAGPCAFIFDFEFHLPDAICPKLSASATTTLLTGPPHAGLTLTKVGPASDCTFMFDFEFTLPHAICPTIVGSAHGTFDTISPPGVGMTVTKNEGSLCDYLFDFDFHLPNSICPNIAASATMTAMPGTPAVTLHTTRHANPSTCDFTFDFEFTLPAAICPTITATATATQALGAIDAFVTVTPGGGSLCAFEFDFEFFMPPAICPTLSMSGSVRYHTNPSLSKASLHILTTPILGSRCQFQTDFNFTLPDKSTRLGKTNGKLDKGKTGPVKIYTGTPQGSETFNGTTVTVYNRFADVGDDKWVHVVNINNKLELGAADCG